MSHPAWLPVLALVGTLASLLEPREPAPEEAPGAGGPLPRGGVLTLAFTLGVMALAIVPSGERSWAALAGLVAGLGLGYGCAWRIPAIRTTGGTLAIATLASLVGPTPLVTSYAHLGLVAGVSGMAVLAWLGRAARLDEVAQAASATSALALAAIWADRALSGAGLWALAAGGLVVTMRVLVARLTGGLAPLLLVPMVALATIPPGLWLLSLPPAGWLTPTLGVLLAAMLGLLARAPGTSGLTRWAPLLAVGGTAFLVTRLLGMPGLALTAAATGLSRPRPGRAAYWVALSAGALALRETVQILVDRTYLHASGIDLTHPYAFASLVAGLALTWTMTRPETRRVRWLPLLVLLAPTTGLLFHGEALAACMAGILAGTLVLGLGGLPTRHGRALGAFATLFGAIALWSAPWLLAMRDVPRLPRLVVWVGLMGLLAAGTLWPDRASR